MPSKVQLVSSKELEGMHTGTLMSRRDALLKCEESFEHSDRNCYEKEPKPSTSGFIEFKDTAEWQQAYEELRDLLASRENIPSKKERKVEHQSKARGSK